MIDGPKVSYLPDRGKVGLQIPVIASTKVSRESNSGPVYFWEMGMMRNGRSASARA